MEQELRKHFNFRLPPSLMERVDRARGKAGRTAFVEQAILDKLKNVPVDIEPRFVTADAVTK